MITIQEEEQQPLADRVKVLIVDDDRSILRLLGTALETFGHDYVSAEDGLVAVEKLKKEAFSVVITDMMMPNMDGMQLLKHVKEHYPRTDVIVVTGHTETYKYTDVIKSGASDFISKPFNIDELEAKLNRVIREQKLIHKLEHLSMCDVLTDLFNRRCFDAKIKEEIPRAHRQGYPIFLALLDVDRFKDYNDNFGHMAGDVVLQEIGKILVHCTRENVDWAFRIGGDEFAIILPYTTLEQAVHIAERILERYQEGDFSYTSLSIGLSQFIRHSKKSWGDDIDNLISRADKALYKSKHSGGNKITCDSTEAPIK